MRKLYLKFLGLECLYLLVTIVIACVSAMIQMIGRGYTGDYADIIFSGANYSYHFFFYILGFCIYAGYLIFSYQYFLSERIDILDTCSIKIRILYILIALLFSVLMMIALVFVFLFILGLTDNMKPEILMNFTVFGFPLAMAVYMTAIAVIRRKHIEK
ncbi:MAG: hypothetical protein IJ642_02080 [Oscillospiraceae bacterium]|nr:hypothetical protein [Oscillospiraceae bacterium]